MTSRKGRRKITLEVPSETVEVMKDQDDPMWKVTDQAVKMALGLEDGGTEGAFERRIEELEGRESNIQNEIESLQDELESVQDQLERERQRYEEFCENQATIVELQDDILDDMKSTTHKVFAHRDTLREIARREYGRETSENMELAVGDLKDRRDDRELSIPDSQFTDSVGSPSVSTADGGEPQFSALTEEDDD